MAENTSTTDRVVPIVGFNAEALDVDEEQAVKMLEALNAVIDALEVIGDDLSCYKTYSDNLIVYSEEIISDFFTDTEIFGLRHKFVMFRACYLHEVINYDNLLQNWKLLMSND